MIDLVLVNELAELVAERVAAKLRAEAPKLVTKRELCDALGLGPAQIDRYAARGMPRVYLDSRPRFDIEACRAWCIANANPRRRGGPRPARPEELGTIRRITRGGRHAA